MTTPKRILLHTIAAAALIGGSSAYATPALQGWTGGSAYTSGGDQLYGWNFNVLDSITVSSLGVYDFGSDGLAISHDVGIFRVSDAALMGSTTVPAGLGGTLDGGFRYTGVASFNLAPGAYVIAMTMPVFNNDLQFATTDLGSVVTAPEIEYLTSAFDEPTPFILSFPNPSSNGAFDEGMFGPNFQFDGAAVPDAGSTMGLLAAGLTCLVGLRRRR